MLDVGQIISVTVFAGILGAVTGFDPTLGGNCRIFVAARGVGSSGQLLKVVWSFAGDKLQVTDGRCLEIGCSLQFGN